MDRRRFLLLLGVTTSGVVLSTGLIELPRKMVLAAGGRCSFCNRKSHEARGMAGVAGKPIRICSDCVSLCFELLAEEDRRRPPTATEPTPPLPPPTATDREIEEWLARVGLTHPGADETNREYPPPLGCSFCDADRASVRKLIAGPASYICDGCIGDAASFLHAWRDA